MAKQEITPAQYAELMRRLQRLEHEAARANNIKLATSTPGEVHKDAHGHVVDLR